MRDGVYQSAQAGAESIARQVAAPFTNDTFGPVPLAIYFGKPGEAKPDPFFDGEGPERVGCDRVPASVPVRVARAASR